MKRKNDVSRRKFLQTAASAGVVAGMVTASIPVSAIAEAEPAKQNSRLEDPLENILSRYGSELGHVQRIG